VEFLHETTGANYEMAKLTAARSGSHLITDLRSRWKEIEIDRTESGVDLGNWTPFAKALLGVVLKHLENVPIAAALELRQEGRLQNMRAFFRKVWKASAEAAEYSDENIENLAAELLQRINEAEDEWRKIDRRLIEILGASITAAVAEVVSKGTGAWVPAATTAALGATAGLAVRAHHRRSFENRFPAAFFLNAGK
jgi:hypothetical protein